MVSRGRKSCLPFRLEGGAGGGVHVRRQGRSSRTCRSDLDGRKRRLAGDCSAVHVASIDGASKAAQPDSGARAGLCPTGGIEPATDRRSAARTGGASAAAHSGIRGSGGDEGAGADVWVDGGGVWHRDSECNA